MNNGDKQLNNRATILDLLCEAQLLAHGNEPGLYKVLGVMIDSVNRKRLARLLELMQPYILEVDFLSEANGCKFNGFIGNTHPYASKKTLAT